MKLENKVVAYGGNGLQFEYEGGDRPRIDVDGEGEYTIYGLSSDMVVNFNKQNIDDLIILLQEVKAHNYLLDY